MSFNLNRAAIFRDAHSQARKLLTYGCFRGTYRQALSEGLRLAWYAAKFAAEEAAYEASLPPIPADVAARIRDLVAEAEASPINRLGNERHAALLAEARDLRDAARGITF